MDLSNHGKVIDTGVLVLGSGAAGCGAAMGAKEQGAKVLIVDKGKIESSGALGGGNDHFMAHMNTGPEWDTDEAIVEYFQGLRNGSAETIYNGWVKVIPKMVKRLEEMGVEFVKNPDDSYLRTVGFGQPGPWWLNIRDGQFVKRRMAKWIRKQGIDVIDHLMITKLLTNNGNVVGAVGFDILDGTFYILRAKVVVMALGCTVARVMNNSTGNPFNCMPYPYDTGSQCVMAFDAGAKIYNLDITQMATIFPKGWGAPGMNALNSMGARELNAFGERFMGKYDPNWENCPRARQVLGTYQEILEGKGPPFYIDVTHFSESEMELLKNLLVGDKATFGYYLEQKGLDISKEPMEVEISGIHFGGNILVNNRFESTLGRLFVGCIFNYFSGALCGGYSAGIEAAKAVAGIASLNMIDDTQVLNEKKKIFQPMNLQTGISPRELENAIRQVMTYYMGFTRNQKGIEIANKKLVKIECYADSMKAVNYHELMRAHEAKHLLKHCQLATIVVSARKETGRSLCYRRSDYPNLDENMNKWTVMWQESGVPKLSFEPIK
jgi:succinate dehydrogenase/fumarate reductase flavoprotein subunit